MAYWKPIEEEEDTKEVIRSHKSENRQYNSQEKKDKQWSTRHYKTKTPQKPEMNSDNNAISRIQWLMHNDNF